MNDKINIDNIEYKKATYGIWVSKGNVTSYPYVETYYCSECENATVDINKFCPHCGAEMLFKQLDIKENK